MKSTAALSEVRRSYDVLFSFLVDRLMGTSPRKDFQWSKTKRLSSHPSSPEAIFCFIDPPSDMERAIFELDAIGLAAAEKLDGILVDERHVPQIQNQLVPRCLDGEQLLKLLDILCGFDPAAECEQNSTIPCSPSS
jgi:hypothetical protein